MAEQKLSKDKKKSWAIEVINTLEWLVTAFMLAFVFRAFVMEAFQIPTGSMADTLMGAHFRLQCPQCGYLYNHGFVPEHYDLRSGAVPYRPMLLSPPKVRAQGDVKCPSCSYRIPVEERREVTSGDRILVLKCIYQMFEPKRWDVIVFKNPLEPKINFIKRLIALPGETVEIIDGDIYIDGKIARKPPAVQEELWHVIYDHDYQPARPDESLFNAGRWRMPFENAQGAHWSIAEHQRVAFVLNDESQRHTMIYNPLVGNDFRATYAYNTASLGRNAEMSTDVMVRFHVEAADGQGHAGVGLSKYGTIYRGIVDLSARSLSLMRADGNGETELARAELAAEPAESSKLLRLANVDRMLVLEYGNQRLTYDLGVEPGSLGEIPAKPANPRVEIFGAGKLTLSHLAIYRDIHYISPPGVCRGCAGNPFTLQKDEFYVLGDNSPNSHDSRAWAVQGYGNAGTRYPSGIVPRSYLVGKALCVYWPGGFAPFRGSPIRLVPDFGLLRLIYGGSDAQFGTD